VLQDLIHLPADLLAAGANSKAIQEFMGLATIQ
jgi:hypothetical protein